MKISLYDIPPSGISAGGDDDSGLLELFRQKATEYNRDWSITDPLREGAADIVRGFSPSNIENERLQSLVGLDDQQFIRAVQDGRVQRDEWPLGRMPQEQRDAILRGRIAQRGMWQKGVDSVADFIQPTPHREPDTWLGEKAYNALGYIPGVATAVGEVAALGPLGAVGLNTLMGSHNTTEQVYANLRAQGHPVNEARAMALNPFSQLGDLGIKGGTIAAVLGTLGNPYPGFQSGISPIGHTLRNIGTAMGFSGVGAMGEQALTNYRSDIDNEVVPLLNKGADSAASTGIMGLIFAGLRAKQLWDAQKQYNQYRGIDVDWSDITPPHEPPMMGAVNTPPQNPPQGGGADSGLEIVRPSTQALPQGTLQIPQYAGNSARVNRYNAAVSKYGFTPISNEFQPNASAREIAACIYGGIISNQDAINMLQKGGLSPDDAQRFINSGWNEINEQINPPSASENEDYEQSTKQPQTFEFPIDWHDPLFQKPVASSNIPNPPESVVTPETPPQTITPQNPTVVPTIPPTQNNGENLGNLYQDMHTLLGNLNGQISPQQTPTQEGLGYLTQEARSLLERLQGRLPQEPQQEIPQVTPFARRKLSDEEKFDRKIDRYYAPKYEKATRPLDDLDWEVSGNYLDVPKSDTTRIPDLAPKTDNAFDIPPLSLQEPMTVDEAIKLVILRNLFDPSIKSDNQDDVPNITPLGNNQQNIPAGGEHTNEAFYDDDTYDDSLGGNSAPLQDIPDPRVFTHSQKPDIGKPNVTRSNLPSVNILGGVPDTQNPTASSGYPDIEKPNAVRGIPESSRPKAVRVETEMQQPATSHNTDGLNDILTPPEFTPQVTPFGNQTQQKPATPTPATAPTGNLQADIDTITHTPAPTQTQEKNTKLQSLKLDDVKTLIRNQSKDDRSKGVHDLALEQTARNVRDFNQKIIDATSYEDMRDILNSANVPTLAYMLWHTGKYGNFTKDILVGMNKDMMVEAYIGHLIDSGKLKLTDKQRNERLFNSGQKEAKQGYLASTPPTRQYLNDHFKETEVLRGIAAAFNIDDFQSADREQLIDAILEKSKAIEARKEADNPTHYGYSLDNAIEAINDIYSDDVKRSSSYRYVRKILSDTNNADIQTLYSYITGEDISQPADFLSHNEREELIEKAAKKASEYSRAISEGKYIGKLSKAAKYWYETAHNLPHGDTKQETTTTPKNDTTAQPVHPAQPVTTTPTTPNPKKGGKVKLIPLGNDNPDEVAEHNLDILRRTPNDYERKKLLNAHSMTTDDLKRMRAYIMQKHHADMGVQGKRNDIINSIVKFINRESHQAQTDNDTETPTQVTTQPQSSQTGQRIIPEGAIPALATKAKSAETEQENEQLKEEKPIKLLPVGNPYFTDRYTGKVTHNPKAVEIALQNLDTLRNASDDNERRKLLKTLTIVELSDMEFALLNSKQRIYLPNIPTIPGSRKVNEIERYIKFFEKEKEVSTAQPDKTVDTLNSGHISSVRVISFDDKTHQNQTTETKNDSAKAPVLTHDEPKQPATNEPEISASTETVSPIAPILKIAEKVKTHIVNRYIPFSNKDLTNWAIEAFGGSIGEGAYDQKQAYDAMEMGINMAMHDIGYPIVPSGDIIHYAADVDGILEHLKSIPTQSNRTPEQVAFQQFSTPPTLALLVNWLANITKNNTVLEPSAGTGSLAVFAKNVGATLILNDYSTSGLRADILDALGWGKVYREDALNLGDILAGEVREGKRSPDDMPDRVIMNPPFSAAGKQGTANTNKNGFKHVLQALQALKEGGRLVTILGAGVDGTASSVRTWLKHIAKTYNVRALITVGGKAYQKFGTTFSNAVVVIDKTGATPKNGTVEFAFSGDFGNDEEVRKLFEALEAVRNDIQGGNDNHDNDSNPPKPDTPKPSTTTTKPKPVWPDEDLKPEVIIDALKNTYTKPRRIHLLEGCSNEVLNLLRNYLGLPDKSTKRNDIINSILKAVDRDNSTQTDNDAQENTTKADTINYPDNIKSSPARMAIFDSLHECFSKIDFLQKNLDKEAARWTLEIDKRIRASKNTGDKQILLKAIYTPLLYTGMGQENAEKMTTEIFDSIVMKQPEYDYADSYHVTQNIDNGAEGQKNESIDLLVDKLKATKNEDEIRDILNGLKLREIASILENIAGRLYRNVYGFTHNMGRDNFISRAVDALMMEIHNRPSNEHILAHIDNASLYNLKEWAKGLGIDVDSLIGGDIDTETHRAKLRVAIKRAIKAESTPAQQENTTQQEQESTEKDTTNTPEQSASPAPEKVAVSQKKERKKSRDNDNDDAIQTTYTPTIVTNGAKHHPADLVESTVMSAIPLPTVHETPQIPQSIIDEGKLSDAQMEAITLAVDSFSHVLPNGYRRGFFIGDGTGVGKGREISGLILDSLMRGLGKGKAVWISDTHTLIKDAIRDWQGIGGDPKDIFAQEGYKTQQEITRSKGILFTAYSHMASKLRIEQLKKWLGENFDGIIILDEAHNVNNVLGGNGKKPAMRATNTREFVKAFPKARVLYVSATGATELDNFAMLDRVGLWGYEGAPFESVQDFVNQVEKGGIAAMEVAARDLKGMGVFLARSLSMRKGPYGSQDDVTYRTLEHTLSDDEIEIYNALADIWQMVEQNISKVMQAVGYDEKDGSSKGSKLSAFWGAHQRFFNQIITSMQTDSVIRDIREQLDAGHSVLIQLTNTMEANLKRAIDKGTNDEGEFDLSPKDILLQLVMQLFDPRKVEYIEDDEGNPTVSFVTDESTGKPVFSNEAIRILDSIIETINSVKRFPDSPIDKILNAFGHDNVAEITGRSARPRNITDPKTGKKTNLEKGRNDKVKAAEIEDFNSGKRRILIFSEKGGTGASYHASNDAQNKQKRIHYLLQAGWRADKAIQGLGRSHRSNEANKPEYILVTTDIPGQKRFISTIARRLAQLGALSTGERKSTSNGLFSESDNLEAAYVQTAKGRFFEKLLTPLRSRDVYYPELDPEEVLKQLGFKDKEAEARSMDITKFLNRLLAMSVDLQKKVFARFQEEINSVIQEYEAKGIEIDSPTENVKAISINILQEQKIFHSKQFGTDTTYLQLELTLPTQILTWEKLETVNPDLIDFFTLQSGQVVAAIKSDRKFDTNTQQEFYTYTLYYPNADKREYGVHESVLRNENLRQRRQFTRIDAKTAQALWLTQSDALPDTYTTTEHLITGALLPIWKLLEGHPKIWRVITDDGKEFLGRLIPKSELSKVLNALKIQYEGKITNADSLKKALDKRGMIATLLNKAKLKYSRVNGEKLLEIIPVDIWMARGLQRAGFISMIIGSKERFFFPKNNDELLNRYLEQFPVIGEPVQIDDADEILDEATDIINSAIDNSDSRHLHIIHPSFWNFLNDPSDNPLIHESNYPMDSEPREIRYQKSKNADSSVSLLQHIKNFGSQLWRGRHDIPELANEKGSIEQRLIFAQEKLRGLKRERQANVHEVEKILRAITLGLSPDDFDLFQRAMELRDLHETIRNDPEAHMPWELTPPQDSDINPVSDNYIAILAHVRKNPRVAEAMKKADILIEDLRKKLVEAADNLGMFDIRDRLNRRYYFRHLVLEYYNMQRSGNPHPTFKNPERRGYMKHREGSDKDISSNWILSMGEVFTRMMDDIKILDTLFSLRQEYDIIEDLRRMAMQYNMENALSKIMRVLQDVPDELRKAKAEKSLKSSTQARALTWLFNLAKKGDLPTGDNHEWLELAGKMADAGQLEKLSQEEQNLLYRYIGWLSNLPETSNARKAAKTFLTGIKRKVETLQKTVGNDYLDWKTLIPDDHTIWSPSGSRIVFSASSLPEYMLKIALDNIDDLLGADSSKIGEMLMAGGDKQLWVIPTRLADALDNIGKSQPVGAFGQIMNKIMGAFKQWVTIGPINGRFLKYNYRNFLGDLEAVLQGNPGALYYFKQAAKELTDTMLKGGIATGTLAEFQKRGGGLTTEFMTELERPDRIKKFADLFEHKKTMNPLKWGINFFREYVYLASTLTNFRESILRYAAFLSYIKLIQDNNGVPPFYGMSKPDEVKAVGDNIYNIAFKLANENLGAYDQISANTQWLRDNNFVSFLSWVEVNFSRSVQLYKNIWAGNSYLEWWLKKNGQKFIDGLTGGGSGGGNEPPNNGGGGGGGDEPPNDNGNNNSNDDGDNSFRKLFRRLAKKSANGALRLAITLAMAAPFYFMAKLWNHIMGADENDPNLDDKNGVSLYLGKNPITGENLYLSDIGSAWDFFRTVGIDNVIAGDLTDLFDGRTSFGQVAVNILDGPITKLASNANPFAKAIIEAAFDKRLYPSALHPTPIRDKGKFVAQSFGLTWYYDWLMGNPHKPFSDFSESIANSANLDQSSYFFIMGRKKQFEELVLGKSTDVFTQTRRGEALRNAKKAIDLGDKKSFRKFLREYFRAGGTQQGLKASARTMSPLYGLNDGDEARFIRWLPKEERKLLRRAMRYAERMKAYLAW